MNAIPPSRSADQFVVRLPDGLRDTLKARAAANHRSMNAEIVAILGAASGDDPSLSQASLEALLHEASSRLGATVQINVTPAVSSTDAKLGQKKATR